MKLIQALKNKQESQDYTKLVTVTTRVSPETHQKLQALADLMGETQSWVLASLIEQAHLELKKP